MFISKIQFSRYACVAITAVNLFFFSGYVHSASHIKIEPAPVELQQFIQKAVKSHPRLMAAQAELDATKAQLNASEKAIYNPELELEAEETETNIRTSTVSLSQTIDWGDQRGARTKIASYQLDAAQANYQRDRQRLIQDLLITLVEYRNSSKLAELSHQRLKLMKDFYELARQKHAAGDLNQVELDLAQLAHSETVLNHTQVLANQVNAEQSFYAFYGLGVLSLPELRFEFEKVNVPADVDTFIRTLPQMHLVQANVEASKSTIALRESESSADPTIAIKGGKEDKESLVGLSISIPLNIRNNYSAEIDTARKEYLQAEQLAQQTFRDLRRDIIISGKHYQLTHGAWLQWKSGGQVSMHRQLKLLKRLWRAGDLSTTDYLVQIKQNLDTQSAGIELRTTLWSSWLNWLVATAQIEAWLQLNEKRNQ